MVFSKSRPKVAKRWASDKIIIGWSPAMGAVELEHRTLMDNIVLHNNTFEGFGKTGSQKPQNFIRNRGDFSFTPKEVDQYYQTEQQGELVYISFDPKFREEFMTEVAPRISLDEPFVDGQNLKRHDEVTRMLMDFLVSDGFGGKLHGEALAALVLSTVVGQMENRTNISKNYSLSPQKLSLITSFIDSHSDENITVDDLAGLADISKFHFTRMFKQETGLSPYQYILKHRIREAQNLLVTSTKSLAEIALDVGFSSQSHMNEAFKRVIGVTPGFYRRAGR